MGQLLDRAAIFAAKDIKTERVPVPEWGGDVLVRGLTGTQRDDYEASLVVTKGSNREMNLKNARAKLIIRSVVTEDGKPMFTEGDLEALGGKSASALERIFTVARRLSGLSEEDVDELVKPSGEIPKEASVLGGSTSS